MTLLYLVSKAALRLTLALKALENANSLAQAHTLKMMSLLAASNVLSAAMDATLRLVALASQGIFLLKNTKLAPKCAAFQIHIS